MPRHNGVVSNIFRNYFMILDGLVYGGGLFNAVSIDSLFWGGLKPYVIRCIGRSKVTRINCPADR